jgi:hypothetical protein
MLNTGGKMGKANIEGYGKVKVKVKLSLCLIKLHVIKTYGEVKVCTHILFALATDGCEQLVSYPSCLILGKEPLVPTG